MPLFWHDRNMKFMNMSVNFCFTKLGVSSSPSSFLFWLPSSLVNILRSWEDALCSEGRTVGVHIMSSRNSIVKLFRSLLFSKSCTKGLNEMSSSGFSSLLRYPLYLRVFGDPVPEHAEDSHGGDVAGDGALPPGGLSKLLRRRLSPGGWCRVARAGGSHSKGHSGIGWARPVGNAFSEKPRQINQQLDVLYVNDVNYMGIHNSLSKFLAKVNSTLGSPNSAKEESPGQILVGFEKWTIIVKH